MALALTDTAIRNAKPREGEYKLFDGGGLYLLVTCAGGKLWRLKYRQHGIERKLALGKYPEVPLAAARKARDEARVKSANGEDPGVARRREKAAARMSAATTFGGVAAEYIEKCQREELAQPTINKLKWMLEWLEPEIGRRPVDQIEAHEILPVLKKLERSGNLETAKRVRSFASRVFRYAVATARAKTDPAAPLRGAVAAPKAKHFAAIVDPIRAGELLRAIDAYGGAPLTRVALSLSPHVFVRPGELRQAEWIEIDFEASVWRIPASRMKKRRAHVVPLSRQVIGLFREAQALSGGRSYIFPAQGNPAKPMSENTVNVALRRMGFSASEMTAHGFRAMASTMLNETGKWHPDAIERALAHRDVDQVRAAYHRGAHWDERVRMSQCWSDQLDVMRRGADILVMPRTISASPA